MSLKYEYGLPNSLEGKTFADASKQIEKRFKNRNSVVDIRTKKELMSRLKDMQESKREQTKTVNQQNQFGGGGYSGDTLDEENTSAYGMDTNTYLPYEGGLGLRKNWFSGTFGKEGIVPNWLNKNEGQNKGDILSGLGLAASVLGPMIANRQAMKSMYKPEMLKTNLMNEQQITPEYVNRQQLLRNAAEQSATQRYLASQMGGDWAQRSAMLSNIAANKLNTTGNLMLQSDLADIEEKKRVQGLKTNIQQFNIQQQDRVNEINQQNLANYYNQLAAYKQATGANIGAIGQSLFNLIQAKRYGREMQKASTLKAG